MNPLETRYRRTEITRRSVCSVTTARPRGWKSRLKLLSACRRRSNVHADFQLAGLGLFCRVYIVVLSRSFPVRPPMVREVSGRGGRPTGRRVGPHGGRARGQRLRASRSYWGLRSRRSRSSSRCRGRCPGAAAGLGEAREPGWTRVRRVGSGARHSPLLPRRTGTGTGGLIGGWGISVRCGVKGN